MPFVFIPMESSVANGSFKLILLYIALVVLVFINLFPFLGSKNSNGKWSGRLTISLSSSKISWLGLFCLVNSFWPSKPFGMMFLLSTYLLFPGMEPWSDSGKANCKICLALAGSCVYPPSIHFLSESFIAFSSFLRFSSHPSWISISVLLIFALWTTFLCFGCYIIEPSSDIL